MTKKTTSKKENSIMPTTEANKPNSIFKQQYQAAFEEYKKCTQEADRHKPHSVEYIASEIKAIYYKGKLDALIELSDELKKQRNATSTD